MLIAPIKRLSEAASPIARGLAAVQRAIDLIEHTPAESGGTHAPGRARGHIELRDVIVRYRGDAAPALDGVNLVLEPGHTVALVGPSGSGKTTLANLLPRFVTPDGGAGAAGRPRRRRLGPAGAARPVRAGEPGRGDVQRDPGRQHHDGCAHRSRRACSAASPAPTCATWSTRCRRAWTRSPATTPPSCRAASASGWRSPARCTRTRRS